MSIHELLLVIAVLSVLVALRIGIPLTITWLVGAICRKATQPQPHLELQ